MAIILGIKTGSLNETETEEKISNLFDSSRPVQIVTPNPEIILKSQKDEELFYILNHAEISLADGFGLKIIALLSKQKLYRQTGADLLPKLLNQANSKKSKVIIVNRADGLSSKEEIEKYLKTNYPDIDFLVLEVDAKETVDNKEYIVINLFGPDLLICLFGAPYQEKYINHLIRSNAKFKIGVGLGGAFDFLTGKIKRAPIIMRNLGLEWLYRLLKQPKRIGRIYQATIVFIMKSLNWLYVLPQLYRQNVAVLVYRQTPIGKEILIVEREDEADHWQLIQGGLEGLSPKKAGLKELFEELNIKDCEVKGVYRNLHKYCFDNNSKEIKKAGKHYGFKGQKQNLLIVEYFGNGEEIEIKYWDHRDWKFIKEKDFLSSLHKYRQVAGKVYLEKLNQL